MSSHHFVREKQEPSILVAGDAMSDQEIIGQLFEWCPQVLIHEKNIALFSEWQVKVDVLFYRSLTNETVSVLLPMQENIKWVQLPPDPAEDLSFMIRYLEHDGQQSAYIIGLTYEEVKASFLRPSEIKLIYIHEQQRSYPLGRQHEKWMAAGQEISVNDASKITYTENLEKRTEHLFTVKQDGFIRIQTQGSILLTEEI